MVAFGARSGFRCLLPLLVRPWDLLPNLLRPSPLVSPTQQCVRTGQRRGGVSHGAMRDQRARVCSACVKLALGSIAWHLGHDSLFAIIASQTSWPSSVASSSRAHKNLLRPFVVFVPRAGGGAFSALGAMLPLLRSSCIFARAPLWEGRHAPPLAVATVFLLATEKNYNARHRPTGMQRRAAPPPGLIGGVVGLHCSSESQ